MEEMAWRVFLLLVQLSPSWTLCGQYMSRIRHHCQLRVYQSDRVRSMADYWSGLDWWEIFFSDRDIIWASRLVYLFNPVTCWEDIQSVARRRPWGWREEKTITIGGTRGVDFCLVFPPRANGPLQTSYTHPKKYVRMRTTWLFLRVGGALDRVFGYFGSVWWKFVEECRRVCGIRVHACTGSSDYHIETQTA